MATRPVCSLCGDTREIRADGLSVGCPFHGDVELVQMDPEVSDRIRGDILDHARTTPQEPGASAEPPATWLAGAEGRRRSRIALGRFLLLYFAVLAVVLIALVVLG